MGKPKTPAEIAKSRRAKKRKERDEVDAMILARQNADLRRELAELGKENESLKAAVRDLALACAEAAATLETVDPNSPALEQADAAIGKHIQYTGPILRKETGVKEQDNETKP